MGECGLLKTLSPDNLDTYENTLRWACHNFDAPDILEQLEQFPSIRFGVEQLKLSLKQDNPWLLFPSEFTNGKKGIEINGLIWMGDKSFINAQIREKLRLEFKCLKLKIGTLNFEKELDIIKSIRDEYTKEDLEIRLDANGAFTVRDAMKKLEELSIFGIHSLEQPIKQGQIEAMTEICKKSPIPIALDEELIGIFSYEKKRQLLETIKPKYIILKPSLLGGIDSSEEWIYLAEALSIGWWATSALESNIGLNAIAQWIFSKNNPVFQGLGTGGLYTNNIPSPLLLKKDKLFFQPRSI
ncbi:L-Ala-D/L-Glu epimerase [Elysia marginata]|uniref:L-Ala-D/L-Glu epimerase n=1 Tax=Elysia marginata TaxID=1093978 RepID=A0AAV4F0B7_9GAST|nr:L-Ala-D/L-Glu epimerase [Elysia marginata]